MTHDRRVSDRDRVANAARDLTPRERSVLMLSAGHDLDIEGVAAHLGIGPAEAEAALADAICKLDRALRKDGGSPSG